ncbi:response regulator transcription factor [Bacteroidota bacterium]
MNNKESKTKILIVEDDINLGFLVVDFLESNGFDVKLYIDGMAGLKGFQLAEFDLCIIDIMLPKMDGFSLIKKIKKINSDIPIIILSAKSMKEDKLKGFGLGIDDYITKPFDEDELLCRIKAVLNRKTHLKGEKTKPERTNFIIGSYEFNFKEQRLIISGKPCQLTTKESKILKILCLSKNQLVKREEVLIEVWGDTDYFTGRSLDVFISKLRNYLKEDPHIKINTIPTVGYILEEKK